MGSQITREVDSVLYTRCGLEVGVAASKTFTAQVSLLILVALKLAQVRHAAARRSDSSSTRSTSLPEKIAEFLDGDHPIEDIAQRYYDKPFFLYLGRHIGLPVALEGALKLKEISYIPTEAYSAGEMKHGPIALLDEDTPVVVVATNIHVYDKIVSNIQEVRARGAHVIAIATDGNEDIQHHADDVIYVPKTPAFLQAVLAVVPLQLLAYRIARAARPERRPAAEPGQDRHGRVAPAPAVVLFDAAAVAVRGAVPAGHRDHQRPPGRRRRSRSTVRTPRAVVARAERGEQPDRFDSFVPMSSAWTRRP